MDRLKDHINLHFIGQVKRKHEESTKENNGAESNAKKLKIKDESELHESIAAATASSTNIVKTGQNESESQPQSPQSSDHETSSGGGANVQGGQLKCNSCDIGFSHLSNFVAHKKYYCRGMQATLRNISTTSKEGSNGSESPSK